MKWMQKIWGLFLYAGLSKEEYHELRPNVRKENQNLLGVFSLIGAVMFFLLFVTSMLTTGFASINITIYLVSGILMLAIWVCVHWFTKKYQAIIMILVYVFEIVLFWFSIHVSMIHPDKQAVSAVAFLLVSPLLFYDRPIRLSGLIVAVVTLFCIVVGILKQPDVAETDVWNIITFGMVAIVTTMFIMCIKIRALAQSRQLKYVSQTDILTGLKNRNHFEIRVQDYPKHCEKNLICVYGDVNGLHEINNAHGHDAGDKMLREVADRILLSFGQEHSFRVGGDEFVAFQVDGRPEDVQSEVERIREELYKKGYHVAFGISVREKANNGINMHEMVKEAESNMYASKKEFYHQMETNRNSR